MSNGLDPDQDRHFVCPDLGPNSLQRLPADDKSRPWQGKSLRTYLGKGREQSLAVFLQNG